MSAENLQAQYKNLKETTMVLMGAAAIGLTMEIIGDTTDEMLPIASGGVLLIGALALGVKSGLEAVGLSQRIAERSEDTN